MAEPAPKLSPAAAIVSLGVAALLIAVVYQGFDGGVDGPQTFAVVYALLLIVWVLSWTLKRNK